MKYLFDKDTTYNCLYEAEIEISNQRGKFARVEQSLALTMDTVTNSLIEQRKFFAVYTSPYSGAFDLLDTVRIPKACASESHNMTQLDYFYGQRAKTYDLRDSNMNKVASMMDDETEYVF